MATPPKCKVCGAAHWATEPHKFAAAVKTEIARTGARVLAATPRPDASEMAALRAEIAALRATVAELEPDAMAWRARKAANAARMKRTRGGAD